MAEKPVPRFFLALMVGAIILVALVFKPLLTELVLAAVLAGVLWPLQQRASAHLRGKRSIAASALTLGVVAALLGPVAIIATFVIRDGADGLRFVSHAMHSDAVAQLLNRLPASARDVINDAIVAMPSTPTELMRHVDAEDETTTEAVRSALAATGAFAFHAVMMVIALFFLLVRGDKLVGWLDSISPLGQGQTRELLATFRRVSYAVVASAGITAAVQSVAALVGFLIARVPNPWFFAVVTFFLAFIPAIGAAVVSLFAAALLLLTGHPYMAIFLGAWGLVVVGLIDNLVKPLLIRRGLEIHGGVVFFSLIGGLATFGAIGLLIGPLSVALFLALVQIYHRDYTPSDVRMPSVPGSPAVEQTDSQ